MPLIPRRFINRVTLHIGEVAEMTGRSRRTVQVWRQRGYIDSAGVSGMIQADSVWRYLGYTDFEPERSLSSDAGATAGGDSGRG